MFGVFLGGLSVFGILKGREFGDKLWAITRIYESSDQARARIASAGIDLPEKAYDLEYFYYSGKDFTRWLAFSADNEDIERIITKLTVRRTDSGGPATPQRIPEKPEDWVEGSTVGDWWPTSEKGLNVIKGDFFWIGHDPIRQRLYYYTYSM
jgi:hypothetical protein